MESTPVGGEAYEQLDELYDVWCAEVVEDVPFYAGLASALAGELGRAQLDIVELGAGSGRITEPLARAGHHMTAIDAAPAQLARLRARIEHCGVTDRVRTVEGDMRQLRELAPPASADLVIVPFRGLLHVTPERDEVFAAIHHVLRPGGALAFDVFHPSPEQIELTHGRWLHRREELTRGGRWRFQERARYLPELAAEPAGLKLEVDVRCRWKPSRRGRRIDALPLEDPADDQRERVARLDLQLVAPERWAESLDRARFTIDAVYGWFDARPITPDDDDSIWVARRA